MATADFPRSGIAMLVCLACSQAGVSLAQQPADPPLTPVLPQGDLPQPMPVRPSATGAPTGPAAPAPSPAQQKRFADWSTTRHQGPDEVVCFALTFIFAGRLQDVKGPKICAFLGGLLVSAGFFLVLRKSGHQRGADRVAARDAGAGTRDRASSGREKALGTCT